MRYLQKVTENGNHAIDTQQGAPQQLQPVTLDDYRHRF
jgi:hypothetical protein